MQVSFVDQINLGLLIFAFIIAYVLPFEVLLISYAFLGPLHYLTEISWLHDRKYFTLLPADPFILTTLSILILFFGAAIFPGAAEFVWILLLVAFCTTFIKKTSSRILIIVAGLLLLIPWIGSTSSYVMAVLIPTVVHVYLFTIFFMLFGALKSKSLLGYTNTALFFVGGIILMLLPQLELQLLDNYVADHYHFFEGIGAALGQLLTLPTDTVLPLIASFLAFTYTYHYLNWFSKTSIIEWHAVTWKRALIIGILYAVSVGIYLYDYALGFMVLLTLSFLHVVLEFPLNFKSIQGIYQSITKK